MKGFDQAAPIADLGIVLTMRGLRISSNGRGFAFGTGRGSWGTGMAWYWLTRLSSVAADDERCGETDDVGGQGE